MNTEPMGNNTNEFSDRQAGLNSRMSSSRMMKLNAIPMTLRMVKSWYFFIPKSEGGLDGFPQELTHDGLQY